MMETTKLCLGVVDRVFKCLSLGMGCLVSSILNLTTSTDGPRIFAQISRNSLQLVMNFEKKDLIKW